MVVVWKLRTATLRHTRTPPHAAHSTHRRSPVAAQGESHVLGIFDRLIESEVAASKAESRVRGAPEENELPRSPNGVAGKFRGDHDRPTIRDQSPTFSAADPQNKHRERPALHPLTAHTSPLTPRYSNGPPCHKNLATVNLEQQFSSRLPRAHAGRSHFPRQLFRGQVMIETERGDEREEEGGGGTLTLGRLAPDESGCWDALHGSIGDTRLGQGGALCHVLPCATTALL